MNFLVRIYQRELRGKLRVWASWIFIPLILLSIHQYPNWFGLFLLICGCGLRWWASGYLDKEGKLSLGGPYVFSRNPLYLGSILLAAAVPISQDLWLLAILITGLSLLIHIPLIFAEEKVLKEKFGTDYQSYLQSVNRLFSPLLFLQFLNVFQKTNRPKFRWDLHKRNKGNEAIYVGLGLLAVLLLIVGTDVHTYFQKIHYPSALEYLLTKKGLSSF